MKERTGQVKDKGSAPTVRIRSLVGLFLWGVLLLGAMRFFGAVQFVLLAGLGAAVLAAAIRPLADRMRGSASLRAVQAMGLVLLGALALLTLASWSMYEPIRQNLRQWPQIRQRANEGLGSLVKRVGIEGEVTIDELGAAAGQLLTGGSAEKWISNLLGGILTGLLGVLVIVVGAAYLLAGPPGGLSATVAKLFPPERQEPTLQAVGDLPTQYRWWLLGTLFGMAVIGGVFGLGYLIIGLEFAVPLAVFAAVAEIVPTFGPVVVLLLSLLVAGTQGTPQVLGVLGVYLAAQSLESYVLTPLVMKRAVEIPPIVTLFTIILWGNIFGVAGLLLAIPLDLTIWAFLKRHLIGPHEGQAAA